MPPDELAYCKRIVDARRGTRRTLPAVELAVRDRQEHAPEAAAPGVSEMRARLAAARERNERTPAASAARPAVVPAVPAVRLPADIPPADAQALLALLGEPEGTSAGPAGAAIGKSKATANRYLNLLRDHGIAELVTAGRSSRYRLVGKPALQPEPGQQRSPGYLTIQALAEAVHAGLADADEATREVLEKVWEIEHRPARPHLTVVPPLTDETREGDAQ